MLKILYKDGIEEELEGKVKFYEGSQPALCNYEIKIQGRDSGDYDNLKLVYDNETEEFVYFTYSSYGFYKGYKKYQELYKNCRSCDEDLVDTDDRVKGYCNDCINEILEC